MDITTVSQLDTKEVRRTIAKVLKLPENRVLDVETETDVSTLTYFLTVFNAFSSSLGVERDFNASEEQEIVTTSRETVISVNAYGANAYRIIEKLVSALHFSEASLQFKKIGLAFVSASQIRNLPTAISAGKEQRAQVDLTFSHIHRLTAHLNRGDDVDIHTQKDKK